MKSCVESICYLQIFSISAFLLGGKLLSELFPKFKMLFERAKLQPSIFLLFHTKIPPKIVSSHGITKPLRLKVFTRDHLAQSPSSKQDQLKQVAQPGFDYPHGRRLQNLSRQPVGVFEHSQS